MRPRSSGRGVEEVEHAAGQRLGGPRPPAGRRVEHPELVPLHRRGRHALAHGAHGLGVVVGCLRVVLEQGEVEPHEVQGVLDVGEATPAGDLVGSRRLGVRGLDVALLEAGPRQGEVRQGLRRLVPGLARRGDSSTAKACRRSRWAGAPERDPGRCAAHARSAGSPIRRAAAVPSSTRASTSGSDPSGSRAWTARASISTQRTGSRGGPACATPSAGRR